MDQQHRRSTAQNQIAPLAVLADQPVKVRQVPVSSADKNFQQRLQQRILEVLRTTEAKVSTVKAVMRLSVSGSVTSVNATCCRLLAVGARWAASTIIPSARSGTGDDVNARFERRERHSASICSGEGSPPRSTGCTFSSGNSPCRTAAGRTSRDAMSADDAGVRALHADRPASGRLA